MEAEAYEILWQKTEVTEERKASPVWWKKWQKHSAADVISVQEAARLVSEGAEEELSGLRLTEMRIFKSNQSKLVSQSTFHESQVKTCSSGQPRESGVV